MHQAPDSSKQQFSRGWAKWRQEVVPEEAVDGLLAGHFRARQINALVSMLPLVTVGNAANVMGICWVFWGSVSPLWLGLWCFCRVCGR